MRTKTIAANWKSNASLRESKLIVEEILRGSWSEDREVIIAAPYPYIPNLRSWLSESPIKVAAQDCSQFPQGAYTGEVSSDMLSDLGVEFVILGHSERRAYFKEGSEILSSKIKRALDAGLKIIYCVGETLEERNAGKYKEVVADQLKPTADYEALGPENLILAYEPVWAIGTGETASPEQAEEMHQAIRLVLSNMRETSFAKAVRVLYGGSVKPGNASELFSMYNIDGGLVGGASLVASDFIEIIRS